MQQKILKHFKQIGVIYKKSVRLRSGKVSNFYCDIKKIYGYQEIFEALADEIGSRLVKKENCIAVAGYGGLPLGTLVASRFNRKLTLIRDSKKDHGKGDYIDGYVPNKKDTCVIIDDVITSGSSINQILRVLNGKTKVSRAIVVIEREKVRLPVPYDFLFHINELT